MNIIEVLESKELKSIDKRGVIADALNEGELTVPQIVELVDAINAKKLPIVFEAIEAVTNSDAEKCELSWLQFATDNISSEHHTIKREASRIIGNIAHQFPHHLDKAIGSLLVNTKNESKVVRWGSAYAFAGIIVIPAYANSDLFDQLTEIANSEVENAVKNQYLKALKKAATFRK